MGSISRREFVRLGAGAASAAAATKSIVLDPTILVAQTAETQRKIRFVSIGTGIRGCDLLRSARKLPNGVCVGTHGVSFIACFGDQRSNTDAFANGRIQSLAMPSAANPPIAYFMKIWRH